VRNYLHSYLGIYNVLSNICLLIIHAIQKFVNTKNLMTNFLLSRIIRKQVLLVYMQMLTIV